MARQHARLREEARKHGYAPSVYAQLLFDAAFAARIGQLREQPASDAELDRQVTLALILAGIGDSEEIARATGLPESLVVRILDGWRTIRRGKSGKGK
ncbi:MAG: hypothetical protein AB7O88_23680 [Reyranellaceae bacterium]